MIIVTNISNYDDSLIKIKCVLKQWNKFRIITFSLDLTALVAFFVADFDSLTDGTTFAKIFSPICIVVAIFLLYQLFVVPLIIRKKFIDFLKKRFSSGSVKSEALFTFDDGCITFPDFDADKKIIQATMNYIQFKTIIYFKREKVLLFQRSYKPNSIPVLLDKVDDKTINDIFALLPKNKFHQVAK